MEIINRYENEDRDFFVLKEGEKTLQAEAIFGSDKPRSRVIVDLKKRLTARLQESSAIENSSFIKHTGIGQVEGEYCFLQESGKPLKFKPLPVYLEENEPALELVVDWMITLAGVAREAEEKDIQWPGFSLEAVRISDNGELYLVDPGVLAVISQYQPGYEQSLPEVIYQPPEIIRGQAWDEQSRLYSLGVIAYYLLTGKPPFTAGDKADLIAAILNTSPVEPRFYNHELSVKLNELLVSLLAREKEKRPAGMEVLQRELRELKEENYLRAGKQEMETSRSRSQRAIKTSQRKQELRLFFRKRWMVLAGIIGIVALGLLVFLPGDKQPVITGDTTPRQVVEYFYQSINRLDVILLEETTQIDLNRLEKMVSENYVMEKIRSAYNGIPGEGEEDRLFGIKDLHLEELESEPQPLFQAEYTFFINRPAGEDNSAVITSETRMSDQLKLKKPGERWQIVEISGSVEKLIAGETEEFLKGGD